jgi:hypothetical protein
MAELEDQGMPLFEVSAVLNKLSAQVAEVALPVDGDPVKGHAVPSAFLVEVVPLDSDELHGLVLVMSAPILVVEGVSI